MNKRLAFAAGAVISSISLSTMTGTAAAGPLGIDVPAPVSTAEATAADVLGLVGVGHTAAQAGPTSQAAGNVLELGDAVLVGGSQQGPGSNSGSILDTGQTDLGRLAVAPWDATVAPDNNSASANAAAARVSLLDPEVIGLDVLQSSSAAQWDEVLSRASASSDAVVLRIGTPEPTVIKILHAESDSEGHGFTYLISINDETVIGIDTLNQALCSLDLGLAQLSCLNVSGGVGQVLAQVLGVSIPAAGGLDVNAIRATVAGGAGSIAPALPVAVPELPALPAAVKGLTASSSDDGPALPSTGFDSAFYAAFAAALVALGTVLVRMRNAVSGARG
jgi:hypothetical protein